MAHRGWGNEMENRSVPSLALSSHVSSIRNLVYPMNWSKTTNLMRLSQPPRASVCARPRFEPSFHRRPVAICVKPLWKFGSIFGLILSQLIPVVWKLTHGTATFNFLLLWNRMKQRQRTSANDCDWHTGQSRSGIARKAEVCSGWRVLRRYLVVRHRKTGYVSSLYG